MIKIINGLLFLIFTIGVVLAMLAQAENQAHLAEFEQLSAEYGHFPIEDQSKIHVLRLKSEDPLYFRFRIFLPANQAYSWRQQSGSSYGYQQADAKEFLAQMRLRYNEQKETLMVYTSSESGSSLSKIYSGVFSKFIHDHQDQLIITVASEGEILKYELDEVIELVKIKVPDDLFAEFAEKYPRHAKHLSPTIFLQRLGTNEAFSKAEQTSNQEAIGE